MRRFESKVDTSKSATHGIVDVYLVDSVTGRRVTKAEVERCWQELTATGIHVRLNHAGDAEYFTPSGYVKEIREHDVLISGMAGSSWIMKKVVHRLYELD